MRFLPVSPLKMDSVSHDSRRILEMYKSNLTFVLRYTGPQLLPKVVLLFSYGTVVNNYLV